MHRAPRVPTLLVLAGLAGAFPARADRTCPAEPIVFAEGAFRGFYVDHLDGTTLDSVTLRYDPVGPTTGSDTVALTARRDAYDGPILGVAVQTFFPPIPPGTASTVTFDFGGVAVPPGSRVVFTRVVDASPLGGTSVSTRDRAPSATRPAGSAPASRRPRTRRRRCRPFAAGASRR